MSNTDRQQMSRAAKSLVNHMLADRHDLANWLRAHPEAAMAIEEASSRLYDHLHTYEAAQQTIELIELASVVGQDVTLEILGAA